MGLLCGSAGIHAYPKSGQVTVQLSVESNQTLRKQT